MGKLIVKVKRDQVRIYKSSTVNRNNENVYVIYDEMTGPLLLTFKEIEEIYLAIKKVEDES